MKILYVTSEANPFLASGGLGDVMGALPVAIKNLGEAEVGVIMPLYDAIKKKYADKLEKCLDISFNLSWRKTGATIYKAYNFGVPYYFVENSYYFDRGKLYGEWDDGERFAFFSMAVVEYMLKSGNIPDILHANDWQTALTVIYLKTKFKDNEALSRVKTLYTIHNIEYQGKYDVNILSDIFDLDVSYLPYVEFDGAINLLKGALVTADYVTTVSDNYANELHDPYFAFGLHPIIDLCSDKMCGIVNGIDTAYFDPRAKDDAIIPYSLVSYKKGKANNKKALQEELGLPISEDVPLVSMITRLTSGKGIDLILHIFEEMLEEDIQFVLLGTGEENYERMFAKLAERHGEKVRAVLCFDRNLSKKIYAASDVFLMPSKSEPCGLAQMIACRYGTLPIVHGVGGLKDTIKSYGEEKANGFVFSNFNAHELLFSLKHALAIRREEPEIWSQLVKNAMKTDFTWENSANRNIELYAMLIGENQNR